MILRALPMVLRFGSNAVTANMSGQINHWVVSETALGVQLCHSAAIVTSSCCRLKARLARMVRRHSSMLAHATQVRQPCLPNPRVVKVQMWELQRRSGQHSHCTRWVYHMPGPQFFRATGVHRSCLTMCLGMSEQEVSARIGGCFDSSVEASPVLAF